MPTALIHRLGITAPAETIYRARTTGDGIRAWWTAAIILPVPAGADFFHGG